MIKNQKMDVSCDNKDNIIYNYLLKDGISDVHGGFHVLQNLDYPDELLESKC